MITHNGKYLPFATHHGMPIYAATMGGKMVFGSKWLLPLTLQAIVAAFGAEGTDVIAKTNDYLNQIATTDPQRAQRLANFINEDPMLVCSLVETSKTRWLVFDGSKGYIDTGYLPKSLHTRYEVGFIKLANNGSWRPIINNESDIRFGIVCSSGSANEGRIWCGGSSNGAYGEANFVCNLNTYYEVIADKSGVVANGTITTISGTVQDATALYPACINARYLSATSTSSERSNFKLKYLRILEDDVVQRYFIPYNDNGTSVLLDAENGVIYRNAESGSFTIALTDKQPTQ